ncbi:MULTISPECIES: SDR family NAD(P)-dependent oxidoreductase [unclassified Modestobacter]
MPETKSAGVVLVTGAGGGIGRAIAIRFASAGHVVVVADLDDAGAAATVSAVEAAGGRAEAIHLDVTDRAAVNAAVDGIVERHGSIDVAVNNAALQHFEPFEDFTDETVDTMLAVNFKGYFWTAQAAVRHFRQQETKGTVVNLASVSAFIGVARSTMYSAIKGAVVSFTRTLAAEVGPEGIRVNAIAPGSVHTPGSGALHDEAAFERRRQKAALKRLATPEEVANGVFWLASEEAAFVTGEVLVMDGGATTSL